MKLQDFDFRVWDWQMKYMYYPSKECVSVVSPDPYVIDGEEQKRELEIYNGNNKLVYPYTCEIELWSGLTDKNGKKIYEGDIVRFYEGKDCPMIDTIALISISKKQFAFVGKEAKEDIDIAETLWFYTNLYHKYEIIGNIHENENLLNSATQELTKDKR